MQASKVLKAALIAKLVLVSSFAFAGNGAGYGGPDLNPTTVPIEAERGFTQDEIADAYRTCLIRGDKNVSPLLGMLLTAVYGTKVNSRKLEESPMRGGVYGGRSDGIFVYNVDCHVVRNSKSTVYDCDENRWTGLYVSTLNMNFAADENRVVPEVMLSAAFPAIRFDSSKTERTVDGWGRVTLSQERFFGLRIDASGLNGVMMNGAEATQLKYSVSPVVACLQDQLQKAAK